MEKLLVGSAQKDRLTEFLRRLDFFTDLTVSDFGHVMSCIRYNLYPAGVTIVKQGEAGEALYFIDEGSVRVEARKWFFLPTEVTCELKAGELFGEMALVNRRPRTASVVTVAPTRLFVLPSKDFERMIEANASFAKKIHAVSEQRKLENIRLT